MYDRILVPTDGSSGTTETLEHAIHIAGDNDATLHLLSVIDRRVYLAADDDAKDEIAESLQQEGETALESAAEQVEAAGVEYVTEQREGVPHRAIIDYAEDAEIDLVTMGTHGRTGRDRLASLGSVTERVVENAGLPVLVVHIDGE